MAGHDEFSIHIDKKEFKLTSPQSGEKLRELGNVGSDYDLWEEVPGGQDKLIEPTDSVELKNGMHFFSVQKSINPGRQVLRPADIDLLKERGLDFSTYRGEGQTTLLILHNYRLPDGYSAETVELLIIVPDQYPDAPLDMWWVYPWITFTSGRAPVNADVSQSFAGFEPEPNRVWQRFSRHPVWREGDDLRTFLGGMANTLRGEAEADAARAA